MRVRLKNCTFIFNYQKQIRCAIGRYASNRLCVLPDASVPLFFFSPDRRFRNMTGPDRFDYRYRNDALSSRASANRH